MDNDRTKLSIVIPVYNEEECLPLLLERLSAFFGEHPEITPEVIFVDDHSSDGTRGLLRRACKKNSQYHYIRLSANRGSHTAVFAGLEHATGECAVFLAADLQDPPELLPEMIAQWKDGNRVVWAVREQRKGVPWRDTLFANTFYYLLNRLSEVRMAPRGSDFVLMDRCIVEGLKKSTGARFFLMAEIADIGHRQTEIGYVKEARPKGRTKWTLRKKIRASLDAFCSFSFLPLRISTGMGLITSAVGMLYGILVLVRGVLGLAPVQGWSSLMVVILFLGGAQMIMLGIMGEYLLRVLEECRPRLRYHVEETIGLDGNEAEE